MLKVVCQRLWRTHQEMAKQLQWEDEESDEEEEEETPEAKKTRERLENSQAIVRTQQTDRLLNFQTNDGVARRSFACASYF